MGHVLSDEGVSYLSSEAKQSAVEGNESSLRAIDTEDLHHTCVFVSLNQPNL